MAYLIDESVLKTKCLHVDIETKGEFTRGETVVDVYGITKKELNADVALDLNLPRFKELIFESIEELNKSVE